MGGFFKMFFASLLALIIFSVIGFFLLLVFVAGLAKSDAPLVEKNSVPIGTWSLAQTIKYIMAAKKNNVTARVE